MVDCDGGAIKNGNGAIKNAGGGLYGAVFAKKSVREIGNACGIMGLYGSVIQWSFWWGCWYG